MHAVEDSPPFTVGIIGGGPNCLYIVERLLARIHAGAATQIGIALEIFDARGNFGSGCHYPGQPTTNHLNRIADQISFGADETNLDEVGFILDKKDQWTLFDWCRCKYQATGDERYNIAADDWVERGFFGEVSEEIFAVYVDRMKAAGVTIRMHAASVHDVRELKSNCYEIRSRSDRGVETVIVDFIVLCTGHGDNKTRVGSLERELEVHAERHRDTCYVHQVYPIEDIDLLSVPPDCTVVCRGMGLAAIDFILWVTEGRGGYFVTETDGRGQYRYIPSGREPRKIIPFSESGIFLYTRANNQKMNDASLYHNGIFFTASAVDQLRRVAGVLQFIPNVGYVRQLDFELHVLPLMVLEMALIYYKALFGAATVASMVERAATRVARFISEPGAWHDASHHGIEFMMGEVDNLARSTADAVVAILQARPVKHRIDVPLQEAVACFLGVLYGREHVGALNAVADDAAFVDRARALWAREPVCAHDRDPRRHLFDWDSTIDPLRKSSRQDPTARQAAALAHLRNDLQAAAQGNIDNPRKAAIDGVWRDLRGIIRYAVEFGGLTAGSHAQFVNRYSRIANRIAVGTSIKIMRKILALAEAELLDLSFTRSPRLQPREGGGYVISSGERNGATRCATVAVNARVHKFDLSQSRQPLFANLRKLGLIREWVNPARDGEDFHAGGLDVERETNLAIRADGTVNPSIAVLGPPTEGPLYFHLAAARPYCSDPVIVDAHRVVEKVWERATLGSRIPSTEAADALHAFGKSTMQ
jgi:uncharacterized NAD(P)/FAD-binding protein YdhS